MPYNAGFKTMIQNLDFILRAMGRKSKILSREIAQSSWCFGKITLGMLWTRD